MSWIAFAIIFGAQIPTNLLMWKICHVQLNYSLEVCSNLSAGNQKMFYCYEKRYLGECFFLFTENRFAEQMVRMRCK